MLEPRSNEFSSTGFDGSAQSKAPVYSRTIHGGLIWVTQITHWHILPIILAFAEIEWGDLCRQETLF